MLPGRSAGARGHWRQLPGQAALLMAGYAARSVGSLVLALLLTRRLGPAGYGEISVFLAVSWGTFYLTASWIVLAVSALTAGTERGAEVFWAAVVAAATATAVGCVALAVAAVVATTSLSHLLARPGWPAVPFSAAALLALNALYALLQAHREAAWIAAVQTLERVLAVAFSAAALSFAGARPSTAMWAIAAASLATAGVALAPRAMRRLLVPVRVSRRALRAAVRFSWPLAVSNIAAYVVGWVDVVVLAAFRSHAEVGIYALAYQFFSVLVGLASAWMFAAVPAYARAGAAGRPALGPTLARVALASRWWGAAVLAVGVLVVAGFDVLFGEPFHRAAPVTAFLLATACLLTFYYALVPSLVAGGDTRRVMWVSAAGAAVNLGVDLALVSSYGIWAGAWGTAGQTAVVVVALTWMRHRRAGVACLVAASGVPVAGLGVLALWPERAWALGAATALAVAAAAIAGRRTPWRTIRANGRIA